jgi:hypothetical protein
MHSTYGRTNVTSSWANRYDGAINASHDFDGIAHINHDVQCADTHV